MQNFLKITNLEAATHNRLCDMSEKFRAGKCWSDEKIYFVRFALNTLVPGI